MVDIKSEVQIQSDKNGNYRRKLIVYSQINDRAKINSKIYLTIS